VIGQSGAASVRNQGFMSNAGFVVTDDGVVVFDALGTPALARQLIKRIEEKTAAPIRRVIVSHFHPDHFYGLAEFKARGAEVWAHREAAAYVASPVARERLAERRRTLAPWLDDLPDIVRPDRVIDVETAFELGGIRFRLIPVGPAHTPEDLVMLVENEDVLFVGDLIFSGRLPFVGTSDSRAWLAAIDRLLTLQPKTIVAGHGRHAANAEETLRFTRDYLKYLRKTMGEAVAGFIPFEEAYAATDWSAYRHLPVFDEGNRINAYNTYLLMEQESLQGGR
jgi:glyoxylase-like metal-dependent hydrolase (beta-lactamase superfamily II)